ncbi:MAG TPA: AMP-binding protein [Ilumatobacteraceae bacterium]|nr:AMP-binding protein [Ilumatobacteraceae bacterium]
MKTAVGDVTIRWIGREYEDLDEPVEFTTSMLEARSNRFASALERHRIPGGSVVATLLGRVPDLYVAALGSAKAGCVFAALDASDGRDLIADQLRTASASVVITTPTLFRRALSPILDRLPDIDLVLICGASEDQTAQSTFRLTGRPDVMSCGAFLSRGTDDVSGVPADLDAPAQWHFPIGASSAPPAVLRTHRDVAEHDEAIHRLLDVHGGETYWCTADRGWPTGATDGVTATLASGITSIVDEADFDAGRWLHILRHQHVELLHTSVAALRRLREAAVAHHGAPSPFDLRVVATVGDRLDRATETWAQSFFRAPVLDLSQHSADGRIAGGFIRHTA